MQAASNTAPFTEVRQVLNQLRDKGYRLGIVTRNCRAAVLTMFPDMDEYVDCLHARDDVVHPNPTQGTCKITLMPSVQRLRYPSWSATACLTCRQARHLVCAALVCLLAAMTPMLLPMLGLPKC